MPWRAQTTACADLVAAHPGETIQNDICISQGFSAGDDVTGLLRWMEVNGTTYVFRRSD